ncbi:MAG: SDR family NAD(P)-dependent oxidoreductase [Solirubrobacteraceae bacterium]
MSDTLAGRQALITGASQGLGLAIAHAFVTNGASIFICGRDTPTLERAQAELAELCGEGQEVAALPADVADPDEVESVITAATDRFPGLSILVNNAGVYGPKGSIWEVDWCEWVQAIEINLFGSVLVARGLVPQLQRVGQGKIIQLSGGGATSPLPGLSAYAASKAAIVRFVETLALELREHHVDVNAIAPGALNTRLLDEVIAAGPDKVGKAFHERALEQQRVGGTPLERGAELAVWLASSASDGITGKLLSAVWDPWRELPAHRSELESDVYTLRRIVPGDRGLDWGG